MSYILTPIAVRLAEVKAAVGSNSQPLVDRLRRDFGQRFGPIDETDGDLFDPHEGDEPVPPMSFVIRQLVAGGPYDERVGFKYGYALNCICEHFGQVLSNNNWYSMRWQWAEKVDNELEIAGVPEETFRIVRHLMTRGSPIPIPSIADFPAIGYMASGEIKLALRALGEDKLSAITDIEVRVAVEEAATWLQKCVTSDRDLVCFYA